ncbi:PEP/pyruvate-binding domain-containing protein [Dactylosporangium sp. NPDC006015]|uniref:PEP/pyruvate-binding domain-containing protein n=1 Tax=Dactylosporangium sp. NPDC006015 TaxID=3154576 RepID=UPI00339F0D38
MDNHDLAQLDWLAEDAATLADPALCGNKFARQAELAAAGFTIPPLLCVPAPVFDAVVGPVLAAAGEAAGTGGATVDRARELRETVRRAGVPDTLRRLLDERFDTIAGPGGLVAVRACVVPAAGGVGEDSAADPFAGLSDSFLYVRRADVADRVADCWASAFNPEAVLYRLHKGMDPLAARVAVGVQRMVLGERSFVAFTRDPRDGADRCVIAAAYGIGEGVVQEKADVDHFFVDRGTRAVEARVETKTRAVGRDPLRPEAGVVDIPVDPDRAALPVLGDAEVLDLAALALRVEAHFGGPQDIEGTITADGRVHLVQARPVVSAAAAPTLLWDNNNATETFPGVSCALTYSMGRALIEAGFTDLYRRMGVPAETLRAHRPLLGQMIGYLDGHIYYAIDNWYRLHRMMRCFRPLFPTWEQGLGLAGRDPGRRRVGPVTKALSLAEIGWRLAGHPRRIREFLGWWDERHANLDVARMSPSEVLAAYRALWTEVGERWGLTLINGLALFASTWAANGALRRWAPDADRSVLNGMLSGGAVNRSALAVHSLVAIAEHVADVPPLRDALLAAGDDTERLWARLSGGAYGDTVAVLLREHVERYGDRAIQDNKLESLTPRQAPWTVLPAVRAYLRQGRTVAASVATGERVRAEAWQELRRHCRNPVKRAVLRFLFDAMRTFLRNREDTRFCRSQLIGDLRALLLRQGEHLVAAGRLDRPRDVLDLTVEEVLGAFDGTVAGADLRGLAAVRAAERVRWTAEDRQLPARLETVADRPLTLALTDVAPPASDVDDSNVLTGLASSAGTVCGRAMVVLDPSVTAEQTGDRILVARETDPGWLFLMMSAKALVVERGTLLSHTAVTGRLLGIPTVVAVAGATTRIPDGALLEVDGAAGVVRILDGTP